MKVCENRWLAALVCMGLLMAMVAPVGAARPGAGKTGEALLQDGQWLSFDGVSGQAQPGLSVLNSGAETIDLSAYLPGCQVEEVKVDDQTYSRLYGEGYGHPAQIGWPDLPVLRRDVEIPFGAEVALEIVAAEYADYSLADLGLYPIYPLQPPVPKIPGTLENRPFEIDREFYAHGSLYPGQPLALGQVYIVRGHRVQPVEVWPVAYDPSTGALRIYQAITFRLQLAGSDMARTQALAERYASAAFESRLSGQVLNYNQGRPAVEFGPNAQVGYLIITADAYHDAMLPFVTLKESRGFDVTMVTCSEIGGCSSAGTVKAYIQIAYDTWPIPPSYVLLVGDTNTMPGWPSQSAGEITDLYYATMDGPGDWHPDIGRGRFPVRSAAQTTIMVNKYLEYTSLTGQEDWLKWAAFIATCDLYTIAEGTHNYVINYYTEPNGYTGIFPNDPEPGGDKLYCITYGATRPDVHASVDQGRWAVIYSGHGGHTGWEFYDASDVQTLTNSGMFPFVASHACITGDFEEFEVYGETWVLQDDAGALVFWGSSDSSFWDEDDILERAMFDSLFDAVKAYPDVTGMTYHGLAETEATYPYSARYYWETYNILGDPAVKIFMEPDLPTFTLLVEPTYHEVCASGSVTSSVEIGSILGYSETVRLETGSLPVGVSATFDPISAQAPFTSELTLDVAPGTAAGHYPVVITATDDVSWTLDTLVELLVSTSVPEAPDLLSPPNGAVDVELTPEFSWSEVVEGESYYLEVATDAGFGNVVYSATVAGTSDTPDNPLEPNTVHYWHVRARNACGEGSFSDTFSFRTVDVACQVYDSTDVPVLIPQFGTATSVLNVEGGGTIVDVNVLNLRGLHTWMGDLDFYLDSPAATQVHLMARSCGSSANFDLNLDDEAPPGPWPCPPTDGGTYQPTEPLAGFDGEDSIGTWTLSIVDNAYGDSGVLQAWSLEICTEVPGCVTPTIELLSDSPVELGQAMHFTAELTGGSAPLTHTWDFGGPGYGTGLDTATPVYTYTDYGSFTVVVTAENECGDDTDSAVVEVLCYEPAVGVSSDSPVVLGEPMHFSADVTAGTPPLTYEWDFGGPGHGSGLDTATPVFTYTEAGGYTAVVTVENACGDDTASTDVVVSPVCTAVTDVELSLLTSGAIHPGDTVDLSADIIPADAAKPYSYTVDYDDGTAPVTGSSSDDPLALSYSYASTGTYTVEVSVWNCGMTEVETDTVTVAVEPQQIHFVYLPLVVRGTAP